MAWRQRTGRNRRKAGSHRRWTIYLAALLVIGAIAGAANWFASSRLEHAQAEHLAAQVPAKVQEDGYVSSQSCQSCHPGQFQSWHASFHRTMTQTATPTAVVGDFDNRQVGFDDVEYLLFRRGNEFWARMSPQGAPETGHEVQLVMTTGSHHYQVYWTGEGQDRSLIEFPLAWLIEDQRWIPREAALIMPPHLKQQAVLWNGICIRCHSTHSQPRIDTNTNYADTSTVELGIACEACHGPAEEHIRLHQKSTTGDSRQLAGNPKETIVNPAKLPAQRSAQVCGQCHAIASFTQQDWWRGHWNAFQPGKDLHSTRNVIRPKRPDTLGDLKQALEQNPDYLIGHYWRDGMVRVSGREYNGLIDSPCFEGGQFSCLSCHSMHDSKPNDQLAAGMLGDQACLQCHEDYRERVAEHSHHAKGSAGSRCYNCHMPHTSYGLLKAIRSHQVSSPSVAASVETGRPNACNQCHLDKSLGWTQEYLTQWFPNSGSALPGPQPDSEKPVYTLSEDQQNISTMAAMLLTGDAGQRALAAWSMGWDEALTASGNKWQVPYLAQLLEDPYPAVRYIAARSLRRLPGYQDLTYDFVGSEGQRRAVHARVLAIWKQSSSQRRDQTGESILINAAGELDESTFQRLLKLRDDRGIDLKE